MPNNLQLLKWVRDNQLSKSCLRRHRIFGYEPGFVAYCFGNYPTREPYYPTENDWKLLDLYAENGVGIINVREAWSDLSGYFGKEPQEPVNERGFRRFIEECHRRGLKVTPYISPGYMDIHSPVYRPEWSRGVGRLDEIYEQLDLLCPGSPGHRARFFATIDRLMDAFSLDGFYWDGGMRLTQPGCFNQNHDGHVHFWESATQGRAESDDAAKAVLHEGFSALWNDFICEVYARVKRRNGIVVAHISSDLEPPFEDKCWDYLLVGEGISDPIASVEKTKRFEPYLYRFNDWSTLITNYRERDMTPKLELVPKYVHLSMALCLPYLQFPWLVGGSEGPEEDTASLPGVRWVEGWDHWTEWHKALQAVGNPFHRTGLERDLYFKYLSMYKKMTKDNTVAYLELAKVDSDAFPATEGTRRVSVFMNDSLWVAIANLSLENETIHVRSLQGGGSEQSVVIRPGTLTVLRYYDMSSLPEVLQPSEG